MKSPQFAVRAALATILSVGVMPALAQDWTERPYDPPVGSRWQIESQTDSEQSGDIGTRRETHFHSLNEFTIVDKLPDGFRVVFVNRGVQLSGSEPGSAIAEKAFSAIKDIEIRVRTDRAGKPIAIENLGEVKATMRTVIDRLLAGFASKPKVAAVMKDMLDAFLLADGAQAAHIYIDEVPTLTAAQNTGLKPGAMLREDEKVDAPIGGGSLKGTTITRLTAWDDKTGIARYMRTLEVDKQAMRASIMDIVRKLAAAADDTMTPQMVEMMKQVSIDMTSVTTIDVEGGMARAAVENEVMTAKLIGHTMSKRKTKTVKVTPLPAKP